MIYDNNKEKTTRVLLLKEKSKLQRKIKTTINKKLGLT